MDGNLGLHTVACRQGPGVRLELLGHGETKAHRGQGTWDGCLGKNVHRAGQGTCGLQTGTCGAIRAHGGTGDLRPADRP